MSRETKLSALLKEYGSLEEASRQEKDAQGDKADNDKDEKADMKKTGSALMQAEERATGAVSWTVYAQYLRHAGGITWAPFILTLLLAMQAASGKFFYTL